MHKAPIGAALQSSKLPMCWQMALRAEKFIGISGTSSLRFEGSRKGRPPVTPAPWLDFPILTVRKPNQKKLIKS